MIRTIHYKVIILTIISLISIILFLIKNYANTPSTLVTSSPIPQLHQQPPNLNEDLTTWNTFTDPGQSYSIKYPAELIPSQNDSFITLILPNTYLLDPMPFVKITVTKNSNKQIKTINQWFNITSEEKNLCCMDNSLINKYMGISYLYTESDDFEYAILHNNNIYQIKFDKLPNDIQPENYWILTDKIIKTFLFIE